MNDIKRIIFVPINDGKIEIHAVVREASKLAARKTIEVGHIFSDGSFSGENSIQICGFDEVKGPWSCGIFNHSMDLCVTWNSLEQFLKTKTQSHGDKS